MKKEILMPDIKDFSVNPIERERQLLKERLLNLLQWNVVEVQFTKVDGTERTMNCTLKPDLIPAEAHPKTEGFHAPEHIQRVWDVDKKGWRSFRLDSVRDFIGLRREV